VDSQSIKHYGEIFEYLNDGDLLKATLPTSFERAYRSATPLSFMALEDLRASELNAI
jgi:hypothetical protein